MRLVRSREELVAEVVKAWNKFPSREKPAPMLAGPDLYSALAWLAAHETVTKELER